MRSRPAMIPKVAFLAAIAGALAIGLTTYTFPFVGTLDDLDSELAALFHHGLGDSIPSLPGPPRQLSVVSSGSATTPTGPIIPAHADTGAEPDPAAAWVAQAATADSGAVRAWLIQRLFFTGAIQDTTVRSRFRRVTLHSGCPVISHLSIVQVRATGQVLSVSSDCPRVEERDSAKGGP